tara:strand:+ start:875 stop:1231 length:357 start_codon:yes stop_codon:yes gene_type:complete
MSKGNILIVVNVADKELIEAVTSSARTTGRKKMFRNAVQPPEIVGELCQFSLQDVEVDLEKNADLSGLQTALDKLGEDDYAYAVTVERTETLDIYGSPKKFGLSKLLTLPGYKKITIH